MRILNDLEICKRTIEDHFKYSIKYTSINNIEIIKIVSKTKEKKFFIFTKTIVDHIIRIEVNEDLYVMDLLLGKMELEKFIKSYPAIINGQVVNVKSVTEIVYC